MDTMLSMCKRKSSMSRTIRNSYERKWINECISLEWGAGRSKIHETGIRLGVNFEKKGVKSALVKPSNLCIAFELPISSEV